MPGLFRRPPQPTQRIRAAATIPEPPPATNVDVVQTSAVTATSLDPSKHVQPNAGLATAAATALVPGSGNRAAAIATATTVAFAAAIVAKSGVTLATGAATAQTPGPSVAFTPSPVIGG